MLRALLAIAAGTCSSQPNRWCGSSTQCCARQGPARQAASTTTAHNATR
jgi:hypothetical protein